VDIAPWVKEGETFHYVRLQDVTSKRVFTHFPGADIDAVGVRQGTLQRYTLSSAVLFAFDDDRLSAKAPAALDEALRSSRARPTARVTVVGHADSVGTAEYNRALSRRRARSVAEYLVQKGVAADRLTVRGAGADEPVAPNDTEEHRQQNRRVEITVDGR
jgi:OOP family OmpA-OmpF porin